MSPLGHFENSEAAAMHRERLRRLHDPCRCTTYCGDDGDTEGPGICKDLPREPEPPLVKVVLVHRDDPMFR